MATNEESHEEQERGEFGKLLRYTLADFGGGLLAATVLDHLGFQRSGLGHGSCERFRAKVRASLKASTRCKQGCDVLRLRWQKRTDGGNSSA